MPTKKITLLIVAIVISVICLGFMGFRAFTANIYESRSCEWANIDNIELHTQTDIPSTVDCNCKYDPLQSVKKAIFTLDQETDLTSYIKENKFRKFGKREFVPALFSLMDAKSGFKDKDKLYYKSNTDMHNFDNYRMDHYSMILDPDTGKLWVYLRYKD